MSFFPQKTEDRNINEVLSWSWYHREREDIRKGEGG
jgi:hypothetical protein